MDGAIITILASLSNKSITFVDYKKTIKLYVTPQGKPLLIDFFAGVSIKRSFLLSCFSAGNEVRLMNYA